MARKRQREIIYPTTSYVEEIHEAVIKHRGTGGWTTKSLVDIGIEWARTRVYNYSPFPTLLMRAAAILYGYISFHPFADGNKRTALLTTKLFLFANGYDFQITDDAPEFTRDLAARCLDRQSDPMSEIQGIVEWFRPRVRLTQGTASGMIYSLLTLRVIPGDPMGSPVWKVYFQTWLNESTERVKEVAETNSSSSHKH